MIIVVKFSPEIRITHYLILYMNSLRSASINYFTSLFSADLFSLITLTYILPSDTYTLFEINFEIVKSNLAIKDIAIVKLKRGRLCWKKKKKKEKENYDAFRSHQFCIYGHHFLNEMKPSQKIRITSQL